MECEGILAAELWQSLLREELPLTRKVSTLHRCFQVHQHLGMANFPESYIGRKVTDVSTSSVETARVWDGESCLGSLQ